MYATNQVLEIRWAPELIVRDDNLGQVYDSVTNTWGPMVIVRRPADFNGAWSSTHAIQVAGDAHYFAVVLSAPAADFRGHLQLQSVSILGYAHGGQRPVRYKLEELDVETTNGLNPSSFHDTATLLDASNVDIVTNLPGHPSPVVNRVRLNRRVPQRQVGWTYDVLPGASLGVVHNVQYGNFMCSNSYSLPQESVSALNTWLASNKPPVAGTFRFNLHARQKKWVNSLETVYTSSLIQVYFTLAGALETARTRHRINTSSVPFTTRTTNRDCDGVTFTGWMPYLSYASSYVTATQGTQAIVTTAFPVAHAVVVNAQSPSGSQNMGTLTLTLTPTIDGDGRITALSLDFGEADMGYDTVITVMSAEYRGDGYLL